MMMVTEKQENKRDYSVHVRTTERVPLSRSELAEAIGEGMHTGLRKGSEAEDSGALWKTISDSETTAWSDAADFAAWGFEQMDFEVTHRPTAYGGDRITAWVTNSAVADLTMDRGSRWGWEHRITGHLREVTADSLQTTVTIEGPEGTDSITAATKDLHIRLEPQGDAVHG